MASDGSVENGIQVDWDPIPWRAVGVTTSYELYRNTDDNFEGAQLIAVLEGTFINNYPNGVIIEWAPRTYFDQDVSPDTTYFYWVQGVDGTARSRIELRDKGYFKAK